MNHDLAYYRTIQGHDDATSAKDAEIRMIKSELDRDFSASLDCENVQVNGTSQDLLITKTVDPTIKSITSRPSDVFNLGDIVGWLGTDWIVDAIDADNRITTRGKMRRCNVVLKWLDENGVVRSYPGFCEDATKYSDGVSGGNILQVPDFQIKVKIHLDEHSVKIMRDKRFLLDASNYLPQMEASDGHPSAFTVTRRNVLTGNHAGHGYVELTMVESAFSDNDNTTLMIADYYADADEYAISVTNASPELVLAKAATLTLSATATKNGVALNQTAILFQSSDTSIATVSTAGVITAVKAGACIITAKAGNANQQIALTVVEATQAAEIRIVIADDDPNVVYGQAKRVDFAAYAGGVKTATTFTTSITSATTTTVAQVESSGDGYVVLRAVDDEELIGLTFTLTVASAELEVSAEQTFTIAGWF